MTATRPPSTLTAGDTWSWTSSFADYEAPTWGATVYFENAAASFSATAADSGSDHAFSIAAATTTPLKAGRYKWSIRVNDGTSYFTAEEGWIEVKADPAATGNRDPRTWARRTLDAVEATLEGRATDGQLAHTIKDRSISRIPIPELMDLRTQLRQEVRTEEQGESAGLGRNIKTRFSRG